MKDVHSFRSHWLCAGFSRGAPGAYEDPVDFNFTDGLFSSVTSVFLIPQPHSSQFPKVHSHQLFKTPLE